MADGRVNPNFTLDHQGIIGLGRVYYNLIEPTVIEHALARKEGELGIGGAFLVSTGKFTGRSPTANILLKLGRLQKLFGGKITLRCLNWVLIHSTKI